MTKYISLFCFFFPNGFFFFFLFHWRRKKKKTKNLSFWKLQLLNRNDNLVFTFVGLLSLQLQTIFFFFLSPKKYLVFWRYLRSFSKKNNVPEIKFQFPIQWPKEYPDFPFIFSQFQWNLFCFEFFNQFWLKRTQKKQSSSIWILFVYSMMTNPIQFPKGSAQEFETKFERIPSFNFSNLLGFLSNQFKWNSHWLQNWHRMPLLSTFNSIFSELKTFKKKKTNFFQILDGW